MADVHAVEIADAHHARPRRPMQVVQAADELHVRHAPRPRLGLDVVVCLRFNRALAQMPAEGFIERLLVQGLRARHVVVGPDFRFGQARRGDVALLGAAGAAHGFSVATIAPFLLDGERVSSTAVRAALAHGDLALATRLLGRPYAVQGRVVHGDARGRTLGFPTANLRVRHGAPAARGVYAAWVEGVASHAVPAVVNSGLRPTVDGVLPLVEVHLLDFHGDLYGRRIRVRLAGHLRAERRFESLDALRAQITADVNAARARLADGPDR